MAYRDHWLAKPLALVLVKYTIPLQGRVTNRLCPTGKSLRVFRNGCPAPFAKIFCFASDPNQFTDLRRPVPEEGRCARHQRGAGCGGRGSALDETCCPGRRSRVVLPPHCWRHASAHKP